MRRLLSPTAIDAVLVLMLGTVAMLGFRDTYSGYSYLVAGLVGLVLGVALAELSRALRQPPVTLLALVVVVFFLLGGAVAMHSLGGLNLLPVPGTLVQLADSSVHGWKQLLTSLPPVENGPLLALPYLLGLVSGSAATAVAAKVRWAAAPVLVMLGLLSLVILLGVKDLTHTTITGAVFAVLSVAWLAARERRRRWGRAVGSGRGQLRRVTAAGLCLGAMGVATVAGPHLPGLAADRVVLRSHVTPPFDVGRYPTPLATFRRYTSGYRTVQPQNALYDKPLFRVSGLPRGTRVRIATLDSYNGSVWGAGNVAGSVTDSQTDAGDTFQKVGQVIDDPQTGRRVQATVQVLDGDSSPGSSVLNVWLPTAGALTGITFRRPSQLTGAQDVRYNLSSDTGVMPSGLAKGDSYRFDAVLPDDRLTSRTLLGDGGLPDVDAGTFQQLATTWAGKADTSLDQVRAIAAHLKAEGHYTDGERGFQSFPSGESLYRLKLFTSTEGQLAGDDEQFAAMMGLAANAVGVPARVVVGAVPEADGIVAGKDVHAWVELQAQDGTWRTLPQSDFMNTTKPQKQQEQDHQAVAASTIPPPAPVHPPASAGDPLDTSLNHKARTVHHSSFALPRIVVLLLEYLVAPLLLVLAFCGAIVAAKRWRRGRRRRRGDPARRLSYAWLDAVECAREYGVRAPGRATRREQAAALSAGGLADVDIAARARAADALMFGRDVPSEEVVAAYWADVDRLRRDVAAARSRWRRLRASLTLVTLLPGRLGPAQGGSAR